MFRKFETYYLMIDLIIDTISTLYLYTKLSKAVQSIGNNKQYNDTAGILILAYFSSGSSTNQGFSSPVTEDVVLGYTYTSSLYTSHDRYAGLGSEDTLTVITVITLTVRAITSTKHSFLRGTAPLTNFVFVYAFFSQITTNW